MTRGFFAGRSKAKDSKLYDALGVQRSATEDEIKKAFKKLAFTHHPDRGGDADKFKEIATAYEVLSNPEKREAYDNFGSEGVDGSSGGPDASDIFAEMFGGGRGSRQAVRRTADAVHKIELTLEELYTGVSRSVRYSREVICNPCSGKGATRVETCRRCGGSGTILTRQNVGFMIAMQQTCPDCQGEGHRIPAGCQCKACSGRGTNTIKETFEVKIPKGADNDTAFVFKGKADEAVGCVPGDVVLQVKPKPHAKFVRLGNDLFVREKVALNEALTGVTIKHAHLDGTVIKLTGSLGDVVKPGGVWCVSGLGMTKEAGAPGDLFIRFDVEFPDTLKGDAIDKLINSLKTPTQQPANDAKIARRLSEHEARVIALRVEKAAQQPGREQDTQQTQQCAQQ